MHVHTDTNTHFYKLVVYLLILVSNQFGLRCLSLPYLHVFRVFTHFIILYFEPEVSTLWFIVCLCFLQKRSQRLSFRKPRSPQNTCRIKKPENCCCIRLCETIIFHHNIYCFIFYFKCNACKYVLFLRIIFIHVYHYVYFRAW